MVKSLFPHVSLQLCIFHVLRAFNRGVSECNLSAQQRSQVCSIFEQLVYADSVSEFDALIQQIQAFPTVAGYYNHCWACCKEEWALCYTKYHATFGVRTNNFVESMKAMQELLSILKVQADNLNLSCNVNKTVCMMFNPRKRDRCITCLLYTSPSPRDGLLSRMPSSA